MVICATVLSDRGERLFRLTASALIASLAAAVVLLMPRAGGAQVFANPIMVPTAGEVVALASADLNGDLAPDLIYLEGNGAVASSLRVLLGNGRGGFTAKQVIPLPGGSLPGIVAADVTGDGVADLIVSGNVSASSGGQTTAQIAVFVGNGDGTFQSPVVSSFAGTMFSPALAVGQFQSNGAADIVISGQFFSLSPTVLLKGDNTGHFTLDHALTTQQGEPHLLDLNGDGNLDLLLLGRMNSAFYVLPGNGDGSFQAAITYTAAPGAGFTLGDLNGNGHPDVLVSYYDTTLQRFQMGMMAGAGDGTFAPASLIGPVPGPNLIIADLNGGGLPDL
ncbi:MAG TPA: VCBS repeat-containing protein, partial [Terriglobales bacterium]|nr:VCBS repeat-containing protein [Terriglobales bacterium]